MIDFGTFVSLIIFWFLILGIFSFILLLIEDESERLYSGEYRNKKDIEEKKNHNC